MSKLIMDLPPEPVSYLVKFLQREYRKKTSQGGDFTHTQMSHTTGNYSPPDDVMALTGSSIPLKVSTIKKVMLIDFLL